MIGWVILFCITHIIWGCGYRFDKAHPRDSDLTPMDFKDSSFIGPMFLYMFYGFYDAIFQCYAYWVLGALTNSSRKLAIYAGWYKGIQSAGAAIAWAVDDQKVPYSGMYGSSWGLLGGSLVIALPILYKKIEETTSIEKDLKDTDETLEDVLGGTNVPATGVSQYPERKDSEIA
ncbi:unnamed protein product [Ambrosiozyma monospora]|uniref:Unnamed protein product n=1 Tax=Ambrosiozyma monospora TaxID=43982 RepID=A0ACB5TS62_AMBMO|nr:unnamed protein product [Ambrosiozyma monospora]